MSATNGGSLIQAVRGPITLITVGVLFALNNFTGYGFEDTWPVLLIVFGLLSLARRGLSAPQPTVPPAYAPPPPQQYGYPPPAGGYRQSPYAAPQQQPAEPRPAAPPTSAPPEGPPPSGGNV